MSAPTPLEDELRRLIAMEGPIPVARYMALCLSHPRHGYYVSRDPLGAGGDFVTAPEISQMFGELLGLWAAAVWERMGSPSRVLLVELGPGRGTLMADALRAAKLAPAFAAAMEVHLVEVSPVLRETQRQTLTKAAAPAALSIAWHHDLVALPDGPLIVLANEFFDALPVQQAVKASDGWYLRMVGLNADNRLEFGRQPLLTAGLEAVLPAHLRGAPVGATFEWRTDHAVLEICRRINAFGGAALIIDYGHANSGLGDTLQAVRHHAHADPLDAPGETDLTAHVDFAALRAAATRCGSQARGPISQGEFLRRLGIEQRAARLKAEATPTQAAGVDAAFARLTGSGPGEMGELFKAIAFAHPGLEGLPGFDSE